MKLRNVPNEFELEIRREFSHRLKNLIALKRWIDDTFGQLVLHDSQNLYSYKTRVKEISSVLAKVDGKIQDEKDRIGRGELTQEDARWINAKSFVDIEELIDDWVGCRVITFLHDTVLDLHREILGHKRLKLVHITVHDSAEYPRFRDLKVKKGRDERRINHNGYVGIHYIIEPITVDACWDKAPHIFGKLELQVRTLLQETWGQIQHSVIYKGRMPDFIKQERSDAFAGLAALLAHCDVELGRLAKDPTVQALSVQTSPIMRKVRQRSLRLT